LIREWERRDDLSWSAATGITLLRRQWCALHGLRPEERLHIRHVTAEHYSLQPISNTFHARDIFAPVAAWLAKGVDSEKFAKRLPISSASIRPSRNP